MKLFNFAKLIEYAIDSQNDPINTQGKIVLFFNSLKDHKIFENLGIIKICPYYIINNDEKVFLQNEKKQRWNTKRNELKNQKAEDKQELNLIVDLCSDKNDLEKFPEKDKLNKWFPKINCVGQDRMALKILYCLENGNKTILENLEDIKSVNAAVDSLLEQNDLLKDMLMTGPNQSLFKTTNLLFEISDKFARTAIQKQTIN